MQTFLPYPDFGRTADVLDTRRLGKQRVEVIQVVRALTVPGYAWKNHPAVLMWKGYEQALAAYGEAIVRAWTARGFADTCRDTIMRELAAAGVAVPPRTPAELAAAGRLPPWLGDEAFHRSHQSSLLRKDPDWYGPRFSGVPDDLPYVWPVRADPAARAGQRVSTTVSDQRAGKRSPAR